MKINERLKKLRSAKKLNQKDIAKALGISLSSYQKYEREKNSVTPSLEVLTRISDYYSVSIDYLLGRDTGEPTAIDNLQTEYDVSEFEKKVIAGYLSLPEHLRGDLMEYLEKLAKEFVEKGEN